jgi:hypothetical protein
LSTNEDALGGFWRTRFIIAKLISLHTYTHDLALVDVQTLRLGGIE